MANFEGDRKGKIADRLDAIIAEDLDKAAAAEKNVVQPMNWGDLAEKTPPERDWAIDDWLGMDYATLLAGAGGTGKSLLSQIIASSLAIGAEYLGVPRKPRNTLMWMCEDDFDELWRRQVQIASYFGVPLDAFIGKLHIVPRAGLDNTLRAKVYTEDAWTPAFGILQEQVCDLNAECLFIDNVGQTCSNEIDRHSVTSFVNGFVGIGKAVGLKTATVLLAHPGRAGGSEYSGSTAWENTVRMRWYFGEQLPGTDKEDQGDDSIENARYLCKRKTNYSAKDYRRFKYANGVLIPDDVEPLPPIDQGMRNKHLDGVVLRALATLRGMGRHPTDGSSSPDYLPKAIMEFKLNEGLSKKDVTTAMRGLMVLGKLKKQVVGTYQNRTERFGLVEC